jgi:voltage-gated potassium channel Kch
VKHETILYISDHATNSDSVIIELEATGYDVVSTDSSTEGIALLYLMHSVAGVVLLCQPFEEVASAVHSLLTGEHFEVHSSRY